jgi:hypothetical protein
VDLKEEGMPSKPKARVVKRSPSEIPTLRDDGKRQDETSWLRDDGTRHELIARKAYEIYERRGCEPGHEFEDWIEAERQISRESQPEMKQAPRS